MDISVYLECVMRCPLKSAMGEAYEFKTCHILIPYLGEGRDSRSLYHPSKPLMSLSPHLEMGRLWA